MNSTYSISCFWAMLETGLSKLSRHNTSAKTPLLPDVLHLGYSLVSVIFAMLCLASAGDSAICAALSIFLFHPFGAALSIALTLFMLAAFSVFIRPPYAERCPDEQKSYLVSPIAIAYLLLILPASIASMFNPFSFGFSAVLVLSLLNFEREQVRLYADESTRHQAILVNGELVADGIPRSYPASVVGLAIIAIAAVPEFLGKTWRTLMDSRQG